MAKGNKRSTTGSGPGKGESVSGYFRAVFKENPKWLNNRSNEALFARWLQDHPGETTVPERIRQNLSNVKSVLRKVGRRKARKAKDEAQPNAAPAMDTVSPRKSIRDLEKLEEQIDECLTIAKTLDREGLASVISHLRRARNEVVWRLGQ